MVPIFPPVDNFVTLRYSGDTGVDSQDTGELTVIKHRLNPCKILVLLLYGEYRSVSREGQQLILQIGPFARLIRVPNSRLREYLEWLHKWDFIQGLEMGRGVAKFQIKYPPLFREAEGHVGLGENV